MQNLMHQLHQHHKSENLSKSIKHTIQPLIDIYRQRWFVKHRNTGYPGLLRRRGGRCAWESSRAHLPSQPGLPGTSGCWSQFSTLPQAQSICWCFTHRGEEEERYIERRRTRNRGTSGNRKRGKRNKRNKTPKWIKTGMRTRGARSPLNTAGMCHDDDSKSTELLHASC